MPNFDNLRKQAKQLLRWHRDGHHAVAAQISALLPRFRGLDDRQVLASRFQLADAQEVVARRLGHEGWNALCKDLRRMSDAPATAAPRCPALLGAEPQILVSDFEASRAFYVDKLCFALAFAYGSPPFYGQVVRDAARLNLRCVASPVTDPAVRDREELLSAAVTVDDAKPLFLEYQAAGVPFHRPLRTEPWGARTFVVRDPDGNLVLFAGQGPGP